MSSHPAPSPPVTGASKSHPSRRLVSARIGIAVCFFVSGAMVSAWMSRIPVVKHQLGLSTADLSVALIGMPTGLLIAMRAIPPVIARRSSAFVLRCAILLGALSLGCLGLMRGLASLAVTLVFFGIATGALDITMNVQGTALERGYGRPILSSLHAMYSIGILLGALVGSVTLGLGVGSLSFFVGAAVSLATLGLVYARALLGETADATVQTDRDDGPGRTQTRLLTQPRLLAAGMIAFSGLFVEGAVNDWAGVFLHQVRDASFSFAALGAAAFGIGMASGRLAGDTFVERLGRQRTLSYAAVLGTVAMAAAVLVPVNAASVGAFGILGLMVATMVPSAFSMAGGMAGLPPAWSISRLTTIGYLGTFASPAIIGFLADGTGLTAAMTLPAVLLLLVWPASRAAAR